jgi:hypothetical protein
MIGSLLIAEATECQRGNRSDQPARALRQPRQCACQHRAAHRGREGALCAQCAPPRAERAGVARSDARARDRKPRPQDCRRKRLPGTTRSGLPDRRGAARPRARAARAPRADARWALSPRMRSAAQGAGGLRAARAVATQVRDPRFRRFLRWRMSSSENRRPPRIKCGAGFFRDMRLRAATSAFWENEAVRQKARDSKASSAAFTEALAGAPGAGMRRPAPGHRRRTHTARSAARSAARAQATREGACALPHGCEASTKGRAEP